MSGQFTEVPAALISGAPVSGKVPCLQSQAESVAVNDSTVWVETIQQSTCGQCAARKGCGQSMLSKMYDGRRHHIEVPIQDYAGELHVDDVVEIGIPEALMVKGALLVYLLPIVLMLLGAALASNNAALLALIPEDPAAMLGALTGFVSGLLISKFNSLRHRQDPSLNPPSA